MTDNATLLIASEDDWKRVGRFIQLRRHELGWSQGELAKAARVGVVLVNKIERAKKDRFRLMELRRLERILGWERGAIERSIADPNFVPEVDEQILGAPDESNRLTEIERNQEVIMDRLDGLETRLTKLLDALTTSIRD